jgi:hypothetical protein
MLGKTTNPLLQQTEQAVQGKIPQAMQLGFQRVVMAGLTLMYSAPLHQRMIAGLQSAQNPEKNAAQGAANLVGTLLNQSRGSIPIPLLAPAAIVIMCEILDFLSQAGKIQVTQQLISQCAKDTGDAVLKMLKISQGQVHQVVAHGMSSAHRRAQAPRLPAQSIQATAPPQSYGIIGNAMQGAR